MGATQRSAGPSQSSIGCWALLLRQTMPTQAEAEAWFQQALAVARRQQAKSWELGRP